MGTLRRARRSATLLLLPVVLGALWHCRNDVAEQAGDTTEPPFIESGDLPEILDRGQLRVLVPARRPTTHLPRSGHSLASETELLEAFGASLGLKLTWVHVSSRQELLPSLLHGKGDVLAANLTASNERRAQVAFSRPVAVVREQIVARATENPFDEPRDLEGRRIAVRRSSSFHRTVKALQARYPHIQIQTVNEHVDTEEIIHRVATGRYDLTVADSNLVEACREYRDDVTDVLDLTGDQSIALGLRKDSTELLAALNRFIADWQLSMRDSTRFTGDLERIRSRKVLRMLTRNTAASYFLWRGKLKGFDYELMREFARSEGLRLEVLVPSSGDELLTWLAEGRGDVVAAGLTPTVRREDRGARFTTPYKYVSQVIVSRTDDGDIDDLSDLAGRTVYVRPASSYRETLESLRAAGIDVIIGDAPPTMETERIISEVADGNFDLTLADSHIVSIELSWRADVRAQIALREDISLAWAVRNSNPRLADALDAFIDREYRGLTYNVLNKRYFEDRWRIRRHVAQRVDGLEGLSPYDDLVRKYSDRYGFDWRLIVAQMYQESRFDPSAESFAGAKGLMQVLPSTAADFELTDLDDPDVAIHAGVRYLDWVRERFEDRLPVQDRMWFSLAGYNAGTGHVRDARRLAGELGYDPDRWFGHVEEAMLLLSRSEYAAQAQHGYCRCAEPVRYVREIRERYTAYVDTLGNELRASLEPSNPARHP